MISLALVRASFSASLTFSCAWARSFWLRTATARPSAIFCWRSSIAFISGGQILVALIQIRPAKASACARRVKLIFMVSSIAGFGVDVPPKRHIRPSSETGCISTRSSQTAVSAGQSLGDGASKGSRQRVGEGQQQANGDRDDERGVDQAG